MTFTVPDNDSPGRVAVVCRCGPVSRGHSNTSEARKSGDAHLARMNSEGGK